MDDNGKREHLTFQIEIRLTAYVMRRDRTYPTHHTDVDDGGDHGVCSASLNNEIVTQDPLQTNASLESQGALFRAFDPEINEWGNQLEED